MGWVDTFQDNIDQWNANVGIVRRNLNDLNRNLQGVQTEPDIKAAAPIKESGIEVVKNYKYIGLAIVVMVLIIILGSKGKKSILSGL